MGGSSHYVCVWNGAWMLSRCHQTCNMGHIHHQIGAYLVRNLTEALKVNGSCIGAGSRHDQLWLRFPGLALYLVIVNESLIVYAVGYNIKIKAGKVYRTSVGQMAAVIQIHTHNRISRL